MTNYEFYKEKIEEIEEDGCIALVNNVPVPCENTGCDRCQINKGIGTCSVINFMKWAMAEHVVQKIDFPYDIEVDTPILVSNDGIGWHKGHFAEFKNTSRVGAWEDGKTSFTTDVIFYWTHAKLPDKEVKGEI